MNDRLNTLIYMHIVFLHYQSQLRESNRNLPDAERAICAVVLRIEMSYYLYPRVEGSDIAL
jgi:hypothetical protein